MQRLESAVWANRGCPAGALPAKGSANIAAEGKEDALMEYVQKSGLQVADELAAFAENTLLPGTGVAVLASRRAS